MRSNEFGGATSTPAPPNLVVSGVEGSMTPKEQGMRRYDDPVEVRRGWVEGPGDRMEGPEQFLWRGRLWKVRVVLAHWVETGPWWQAADVRAVIGSDDPQPEPQPPAGGVATDLLVERELWRVEAGRGGVPGSGVFDLSFDWTAGSWQLVGCVD